jgi:hypothetical protein
VSLKSLFSISFLISYILYINNVKQQQQQEEEVEVESLFD